MTSHLKGILAEIYVLFFLLLKGYIPIKWRMRNLISEVDFIVKKNKTLIAIEVKYRKNYADGVYAITEQQQKKIKNAFELFCTIPNNKNKYSDYSLRCDVCVVTHKGMIKHLMNAF